MFLLLSLFGFGLGFVFRFDCRCAGLLEMLLVGFGVLATLGGFRFVCGVLCALWLSGFGFVGLTYFGDFGCFVLACEFALI